MIEFEKLEPDVAEYIKQVETLLKQEKNKNKVIVNYLRKCGSRIKKLLEENNSLIDSQVLNMVEQNAKKPKVIRIKYVRDVLPIQNIAVGDWIDLRCAEDTELVPGQYKMIPLGVAMQLPEGYEAIIAPRSSTFKKYGVLLANSIGVIDESYCGDNDEWNFLAFATEKTVIKKNERICQFRIMKHQTALYFETVDFLGNANRGGIGSTGRI